MYLHSINKHIPWYIAATFNMIGMAEIAITVFEVAGQYQQRSIRGIGICGDHVPPYCLGLDIFTHANRHIHICNRALIDTLQTREETEIIPIRCNHHYHNNSK